MFVKDCVDALIHAIHVVAESIAFLMGMHLMLLLHLVQLFMSNPINTVRQTAHRARDGVAATAAAAATTTTVPADLAGRLRTRAVAHLSPLHLPALGPRPQDEESPAVESGLLDRVEQTFAILSDWLSSHIHKMADDIEAQGGVAGRFLSRMRQCESYVDGDLISRLPPEIVTHILLLAAMPGSSQAVPTKIAVLSKAHHRLIVPRLYANVHLTDAASFRRFRLTLAVYNPALGQHLRALSVASNKFDTDGYLPDQVAEHVTLGVGIEQVLLASPNLQHLYLDLFSLAALHHGTASRLEKGALPISLTTEFSLPQYLTLPTFAHLQHVELTVFGLDSNAVDWFRQVLPRLRSLSVRWVTRRSRIAPYSTVTCSDGHLSASEAAWQDQDDCDLDREEQLAWREGGRRRDDFLLFVEAVESLRRWPYHNGSQTDGQRLEAVSIFAWPKAYRELRNHYGSSDTVLIEGVEGNRQQETSKGTRWWDKSATARDDVGEESRHSVPATPSYFDELRKPFDTLLPSSTVETPSNVLPPAPLRIAVDETFALGPRRGPLEQWCAERRAGVWR